METQCSQLPQSQASSQLQQPPSSTPSQQSQQTKNIKNWFDEIRAKVSKNKQTVQVVEQAEEALKVFTDTLPAPDNTKSPSVRPRKTTKISVPDSPDFDSASIGNIFNSRRDSRLGASLRKRRKSVLGKIVDLIKWVLYYLIPFNYNLPWKLLCLINSCFVIVVIGIASGSSQASTAFSFFNGFVCGLVVSTICSVILSLSFIIHILPKSQEPELIAEETRNYDITVGSLRRASDSVLEDNTYLSDSKSSDLNSPKNHRGTRKLEDFSLFEILDEENRAYIDQSIPLEMNPDRVGVKLDDDNYKGWMIEFIGDYEQRNSSDIKLKSMFVRIEERILYLCKPKNNHDPDSTTLPVFSNQRIYDLNEARKFSATLLLPKNVRNKQKYVWSKKYPIKLEFQEDRNDSNKLGDGPKTVQLTLFAKSCREKEEWFRRFKRIVEENRLATGLNNKPVRLKSQGSFTNDSVSDGFFGSLKRFRRRSPSPKRDCVLTSHSSHLLSDSKRASDDEGRPSETNLSSSLVRTRSCELLHREQAAGATSHRDAECQNQGDDSCEESQYGGADDSTLTRETADLFSQAVDHSNFIESQPSLNYREYIERVMKSGQDATATSDWFNALTGRIFFDVFSHVHWSVWFKRKIQRKLYRIRLPYFMETLTLTKIDLGVNAPQFLNVVSHNFDSYGLSIDFDMTYSGGLTITFETKLNLLKIKADSASQSTTSTPTSTGNNNNAGATTSINSSNSGNLSSTCQQTTESSAKEGSLSESSLDSFSKDTNRQAPFSSSGSTRTSGESSDSDDSDSDSSSDSSFDEADANEISDWEDYGAEKTRQNIVKFVDKIASSRYFQHATENRYIKKKLQDISNCPLVLVVKIESLNGVLTLNVPPPQTDRIWYGFKPQPELILKALPKMGDREVNLSHVTDWIERKLAEEFRKILVIPNMEDIVLPVLKSDHLQYVTPTK